MTPLRENLLVALFTAGLAGVGWLLATQNQTNKELWKALTDAVTEFKVAIQMITEKDSQQKTLCQFHREQSAEKLKGITEDIEKLEGELKELRLEKGRYAHGIDTDKKQ